MIINNNNMKLSIILTATLLLASCSGGDKNAQNNGAASAHDQALAAAKAIVNVDHTDTLALQQAIVDAVATRSQFQIAGDNNAVEEFNKTLKNYLQQNDPETADAIF